MSNPLTDEVVDRSQLTDDFLFQVVDDPNGTPTPRTVSSTDVSTLYRPSTDFAVRGAPADTVAASGPTVTVPAADAATTITSGVAVSIFNGTPGAGTVNTHGAFGITGTPPSWRLVSGNSCVQASVSSVSAGVTWVSGYFYGDLIEFDFLTSSTAMPYRFYVDDVPLTAATVNASVGSLKRYRISLTFAGNEYHKITCQFEGTANFEGVRIGPTDSWSPAPFGGLPIAIVGDSFATGTGSTNNLASNGYAAQAGRMGGFDVNIAGMGGTGWLAPGSFSVFSNASRVANVAASDPRIIVLQVSTNDQSYSEAQITAAVASTISAYRVACPTARIVVLGVMYPAEASATVATMNDYFIAAATPLADLIIDPTADAAGAWVAGTGYVGATAGTGTSDIFRSSDSIHPSQAGHTHYGTRLASKLWEYVSAWG